MTDMHMARQITSNFASLVLDQERKEQNRKSQSYNPAEGWLRRYRVDRREKVSEVCGVHVRLDKYMYRSCV